MVDEVKVWALIEECDESYFLTRTLTLPIYESCVESLVANIRL